MNYGEQKKEIAKYFKKNEKKEEDFKIGTEFEHFIIDKDSLETISYYGKDGVEETLKTLEDKGWNAEYEEGYILGLNRGNKNISLEPGGQIELSIKAQREIKEIEKEYLEFLDEIIPILKEKGQEIIAIGYHPKTKIEDIKLLPKKRYDFMFNYFKKKGSHAHNMMKGSASLQISFDYKSQEDYRKKFRLSNAISPIMYAVFDGALYFQGELYDGYNLRNKIWMNCDDDRSGIVEGTLEDNFSYESYAEYILKNSPIFYEKDGGFISVEDKSVSDLFNPSDYTLEELEHYLTMFFPDVRTKKYIEIRMIDSIPYPLNFAAITFLKALLYIEDNLNRAYEYMEDINIEDINKAKMEILDKGLEAKIGGKSILERAEKLLEICKNGLKKDDLDYLLPLEKMIKKRENPYKILKNRLNLGKKEALAWSILKKSEEY